MATHHTLATTSLGCLLLLGGCGDPASSDGTVEGMAFGFQGAVSGSFAAALRDSRSGEPLIVLLGWQPTGGGHGHFVQLDLPDSRGGETLRLSEMCLLQPTLAGCAIGLVGIDWDVASTGATRGGTFLFDGGTLRVTAVTATSVRGTFAGHAVDSETGRSITITRGSFDVPFVTASALGIRLPAVARLRSQRLLH
ncbi:MAG TPA: hypothetical protein VFH27_02975 [Longimicrobiaceae bacterium]|nr:hypothetical protein [Longimicrobiaceae bacterium]